MVFISPFSSFDIYDWLFPICSRKKSDVKIFQMFHFTKCTLFQVTKLLIYRLIHNPSTING